MIRYFSSHAFSLLFQVDFKGKFYILRRLNS